MVDTEVLKVLTKIVDLTDFTKMTDNSNTERHSLFPHLIFKLFTGVALVSLIIANAPTGSVLFGSSSK